MNKLKGQIGDVKVSGAMSQVSIVLSPGCELRAIVIENPDTADYLKKNRPVQLVFKETEVILAREEYQMSLLNSIRGEVEYIRQGKLLSEVGISTVAGKIKAIISSDALEVLALQTTDTVYAMIAQNEIMIAE